MYHIMVFFFFKQKTAYEMRISDWSSDVCSSDLVPFFHNNDDFDEVLFYHRGDFFSRDNIDRGMITFHPCGFTHGPHPKALGGMFTPRKAETDEYAVMLDARDALEVGPLPEGVENHADRKSTRLNSSH